MKYYLKGTFWFTLFLAVLFLAVFWISLGYNPKARFVPVVLSIPMFLLTLYLLLGEKYPKLIAGFDGALPVSEPKTPPAAVDREVQVKNNKRLFALIGLLFGTYIAIICIGFLVSIPLFVIIFCRLYGKLPWLQTLLTTAIVEAILFGLFDVLLNSDLYKGIFFGAMFI